MAKPKKEEKSTPRTYFPKKYSTAKDKARIGVMILLNAGILAHIFLHDVFKKTEIGHHDVGDLFWFLKIQ